MYENNNKAIVNKLAKCSIKSNRMRNIFIIIAIILTTVLFTTVFTIGISMIKSVEYSNMRQVGGSDHGTFKYLTTEEFKIIKEHKDIKEYGITISVAVAENPVLAKRQVEINHIDENEANYRFISPLSKGNMPSGENKIVLDTITLEDTEIDILIIKYELFCRIDIKDKGDGIIESDINKIFARFYRGKNTKDVEGVGIGLFLSRKIIAEQDGYIKVKSKLGKGTVFFMFLPLNI